MMPGFNVSRAGWLTALSALTLLAGVQAGETKRVAYIEAGPFWLYNSSHKALRDALAENSDFTILYPSELRISPGWDAPREELDRQAIALQNRGDVDLILAAGTAAVRALLRNNTGMIPIVGMDMADPVAAGVVPGADDSGTDNFTCEVIPDRWKQMIRVFHDVVGFSRMGLLVPPGPEGIVYSGLLDIQEVGRELGFQVVSREIPDESAASCAAGLDWLNREGIDAFFIGPLIGFDWEEGDPALLLGKLNHEYRIPTFARDGSSFVQGGALLGFATWDFSQEGKRYADKILRIFRGASPRSLSMRASLEPLIAVNLQTAREIGFDLPFDVLIAADEIYTTTSKPKFE